MKLVKKGRGGGVDGGKRVYLCRTIILDVHMEDDLWKESLCISELEW